MKTTGQEGRVASRPPRRATVAYLPGADIPVADPTPLPLHQAVAEVDALRRALASSHHDVVAAQNQVELLSRANAELSDLLAVRRGLRPAVDCEVDDRRLPARRSPQHVLRSLTSRPLPFSLAAGLPADAMALLEPLFDERRLFRRGATLFRTGAEFAALYAIHNGSCKTALLARDGQYQIAGYHLSGDIVGMDGIGSGAHQCQATALEDTEACVLDFARVEQLAHQSAAFAHNLHRVLAQENVRAQALTLLLGTMSAEQRLAVFLLDLSQRYDARGFSASSFVLRMTREEIGSYLGLKLETVSRQLSRLQREGLIQIEGRTVKLLDRGGVSRLLQFGA